MSEIKRIYRACMNKLDNLSNTVRFIVIRFAEFQNIRKAKNKQLISQVVLTRQQEAEIQAFWEKFYGRKISTSWHRLYQSFTGEFDPLYFPEYIFTTKLERVLNPQNICKVLEDKAMVEILVRGTNARVPKTYLGCSNSYYFGESKNPLSQKEAIKCLEQLEGKYIIKPTVGTSSGNGVQVLVMQDGIDTRTSMGATDLVNLYGTDFIVQEAIVAHESYSSIYANSINTLRIMTYRIDGEIHIVPTIMRIGQGGAEVDNAHFGGMFIGVNNDGTLKEEAYTQYQTRYKKHPDSGLLFAKHTVFGVDIAVDAAKKVHQNLPQLGMVAWDFAIDACGEVVLLEINLRGPSLWFHQMAHGKGAFGIDTEYMLSLLKNKQRVTHNFIGGQAKGI